MQIKKEIKETFAPLKTFDFQITFVILSACLLLILTKEYGTPTFFRRTIAKVFEIRMDRTHLQFWAYEYRLVSRFVFQFIAPLILIFYPLKKRPTSFGTSLGDWRKGLFWFIICALIMTAIIVPISQTEGFSDYYGKRPLIGESWAYFTIFALSYFLYMTGWEFIFRGYMLFGLEEKWGIMGAVLVQTIPFAIMHIGKPLPETISSIFAGVFLGLLAIRTRSFWWGTFLHTYAIVLMYFMAAMR